MATWRLAASLVQLRDEVNKTYPKRDKGSDGTIGDTAHSTRRSDHNPNSRGVVQAWDCTDDKGTLGMELAEFLRKKRDPRVKYVISEGKMFSSYPTTSYPAWAWRPYNGTNKHTSHTHVSVVDDPNRYDDDTSWGFGAVSAPSPGLPHEEEAVLIRKKGGRVVYQCIAGRVLYKLGKAEQAELVAGPNWRDKVQALPADHWVWTEAKVL